MQPARASSASVYDDDAGAAVGRGWVDGGAVGRGSVGFGVGSFVGSVGWSVGCTLVAFGFGGTGVSVGGSRVGVGGGTVSSGVGVGVGVGVAEVDGVAVGSNPGGVGLAVEGGTIVLRAQNSVTSGSSPASTTISRHVGSVSAPVSPS
jgi:hypothetical protein